MKRTSTGTRVFPALTSLPRSDVDEFSLLSFNILTKAFGSKQYYQYVDAEHRAWNYRYPRIREIVCNYCADIICLQECDPFTFESEFGTYFDKEHNYGCVIDTKDTKKQKYKKQHADGTAWLIKPATLYKRDKMKLVYNEFRSRAIVSLFELLTCPQKYVYVVNVHLEGAPRKWPTRFKQIKSILERIEFRCQHYGIESDQVALLVCGDFNDGIRSVTHTTILDGGLSKDFFDPRWGPHLKRSEKDAKQDYKHSFTMSDSYAYVFDNSLQFRPPTFAANGVIGIVDFLYFSSCTMDCLGVSQPLPDFMMHDVASLVLPNHNWISDHLPIAGLYKISSSNQLQSPKNVGNASKQGAGKDKRYNTSMRSDWQFHEMNSF